MNSQQHLKAAVVHISPLSQFFFPFGNIIGPLLFWNLFKNESETLNNHGIRVLNFQFSLWLYTFIFVIIAIPLVLNQLVTSASVSIELDRLSTIFQPSNWGTIGGVFLLIISLLIILLFMHTAAFLLVIVGCIRALNQQEFRYPLSIPFLSESRKADNQKTEDSEVNTQEKKISPEPTDIPKT